MNSGSILLIEDEAAIRDTLRLALELEGYGVTAAGNGQEGLEAIERLRAPCVVLLDLMMPVMDGWQFVEAVESRPHLLARHLKIIVITAVGDRAKSIRQRGVVQDVIRKPTELETLLEAVHRHCVS